MILNIDIKGKSDLCPINAFFFFFMREYTKTNFFLVLNLLMQMCSRTSPAQAEQLLLPNLLLKCLSVIKMISVGVGPGLTKYYYGVRIALPR